MTSEYEQAILDAGLREEPRYPYGIGGYEYHEAIMAAGGYKSAAGMRLHRDAWVRQYAWAIPGEGALVAIARHSPILEVGAGSGYWAYELAKRGADILATDIKPGPTSPDPNADHGYIFEKAWHPVEQVDALSAVKKYAGRTLLFVWPCYAKPWAGEALAAYAGDTVLYVGEGDGGCTGDTRFHELLNEGWPASEDIPIPQWWGIHDRLEIRRRPSP